MLKACDTDSPTLLVYEMWDTMIEKVKTVVYMKEENDTSFYEVVYNVLTTRWD